VSLLVSEFGIKSVAAYFRNCRKKPRSLFAAEIQNVAACFWRRIKVSQPCFAADSKCRWPSQILPQSVAAMLRQIFKVSQPI
jgi:hypothetical protein